MAKKRSTAGKKKEGKSPGGWENPKKRKGGKSGTIRYGAEKVRMETENKRSGQTGKERERVGIRDWY